MKTTRLFALGALSALLVAYGVGCGSTGPADSTTGNAGTGGGQTTGTAGTGGGQTTGQAGDNGSTGAAGDNGGGAGQGGGNAGTGGGRAGRGGNNDGGVAGTGGGRAGRGGNNDGGAAGRTGQAGRGGNDGGTAGRTGRDAGTTQDRFSIPDGFSIESILPACGAGVMDGANCAAGSTTCVPTGGTLCFCLRGNWNCR